MEDQKSSVNNNPDSLRAMASETSSLIGSEYTVEERDTIPESERKFGLSWQRICEANKDVIKEDTFLQPGIRLKIPSNKTGE